MDHKFLAINKDILGLGLKSIDLLIISQIEEFQRNNRDCYVTNEQFAEQFGASLNSVKRSIAKLEAMKIIRRKTMFIEGNGRSNRQRILTLTNKSDWSQAN